MLTHHRLDGILDCCGAEWIGGWARFADAPERRPELEIWCGPTLLGRCTADVYRVDLQQAGLDDGCHGFRLQPPPGLTQADLAAVRITVCGTDWVFHAGSLRPRLLEPDWTTVYRRPGQRRFARCILHIGTEKTGSTTLQAFLGRNHAALAAAGYFVPLSLAQHGPATGLNHVHLCGLAMRDDRLLDGLRTEFGITGPSSLRAYREATFAALDHEIRSAPAQCTTLLLSNEHCHSRLVTTDQVAHLHVFLAAFCDAVEVHVYLRPQYALAMSSHGMMLMLGHPETPLLPPVDPGSPHRTYFDYGALCRRWADIFGAEMLRPRIFQRSALAGGDVVQDFTAALGLDGRGLTLVADRGGNLSAPAQQFLRHLYRAAGGQQVPIARRLRLADALRRISPGDGILPTRAEAQAFMDQFAVGNETIRRRWFPTRPTLFECDFTRFPTRADPDPPPDPALWPLFIQAVHQAR